MTTKERDVVRGNNMWKGSVPSFQFFVVVCAGVNNCAHTLVVLVLCVFGTCRAFLLAEVFSHGVLLSSFHVHPCLFASRALELVSAQFLSLILM